MTTYLTRPEPQASPFRWVVYRSDTKSVVAEVLTDEQDGWNTERIAVDLAARLNGL
jgi:hypothetical protein